MMHGQKSIKLLSGTVVTDGIVIHLFM